MKQKFELEYTFNASVGVLFPRLSTPAGLAEWFADDVNVKNDVFTFLWDGSEQQAIMISKKDNKCIRFHWVDDEEEDTYFEFMIKVHELTGDVAIVITDFADEDEKPDSIDLWDTQIAELKHALGL